MDIVTQGLAGAVLAQSVSKKEETRVAMAIGFLAGLFADIDALFTHNATDPLLELEFHRHFSHAILFIPIGGFAVACLLWLFFRNVLPFKRIWLFSTIAYASSGLIDACTSYGTHLLWPFSDARTAWNIIAIIDPLFSFALILGIGYAAFKRNPKFAIAGVSFALSYLIVGAVQHQRAEVMLTDLAATRGHTMERFEVKPTMGNLVLWRSVYAFDGHFYADGIRLSLFGENRYYEGQSIKQFETTDLPELKPDSVMAKDIQRFAFFSNHYTGLIMGEHMVVGDIRYAMLPNLVKPIWGIELDLDNQHQHTPFKQYHDLTQEQRNMFLAMLMGEEISGSK